MDRLDVIYLCNYRVTSGGDIYNIKTGRKLKPWIDKQGYYTIRLAGSKNLYVHRIVAQLFIPNPENKKEVNHKDGIKTNNSISNLEWLTRNQNIQHAYDIGIMHGPLGHKNKIGTLHHNVKLTEAQVLEIRKIGKNKTLKELSEVYKVSFKTISKILNRKRWKHI